MHFDKPTYSVRRTKKKDIPEGLYTKDPVTGEILFNKEIEDNQMVVPKSGHHFPIGARQRIAKLLDADSFVELHAEVRSGDPLKFVDSQPYPERIKRYQRESGLPEAVVCGTGAIHGIPVAIAVMDFRFCGGAMGSAAGEKITRTIEDALEREDTLHHRQRLRRRPHAGGHLFADADGEDERGPREPCPGRATLYLGAHPSDHGRRHRELCDAWAT